MCEARNCTIVEYTNGKHFTSFTGRVHIDERIAHKVDDLDFLAQLCHARIHVLKSFILHHDSRLATTLDLRDSVNPNHYVGQAISFNVYDENERLACNDACLGSNCLNELFLNILLF
jgi:hypothetical protein